MSYRLKRVSEVLKEEVSKILLRELDFSPSLVTIISVNVSSDLRHAQFKITVIPEENQEVVLKKIRNNIFDLQQALNKKLNMRPIPKIEFAIDKSEIKAQRIEKLLGQIKTDK